MSNKKEKQIKKSATKDKRENKAIPYVTETDIQAALLIVKNKSESLIRKVVRGDRHNERITKVLRELVIARKGAYKTVEQINEEQL